jgi:hypothetical protein
MADCYRCGTFIPRGQGYRREVYTGHSNRIYFGRRISGSTGNRYGVRTICATCAVNFDRSKRNVALFWLAVVGGFFLLGGIGSLTGPPDHSPTIDTTSTTTSASVLEIPSHHHSKPRSHKKVVPKEESTP